jgi:3-(3-hydroxy-phenyl)propionate hydroxylase
MVQLSSSIYDVAIVGCGPTGATLAGLLGQAGLRVLICDKDLAIISKTSCSSHGS